MKKEEKVWEGRERAIYRNFLGGRAVEALPWSVCKSKSSTWHSGLTMVRVVGGLLWKGRTKSLRSCFLGEAFDWLGVGRVFERSGCSVAMDARTFKEVTPSASPYLSTLLSPPPVQLWPYAQYKIPCLTQENMQKRKRSTLARLAIDSTSFAIELWMYEQYWRRPTPNFIVTFHVLIL